MTAEREYVESVWESPYVGEVAIEKWRGGEAHAAEWTRAHMKRVRQKAEEVALAAEMAEIPAPMKTLYADKGLEFSPTFTANRETAKRILATLEAQYADLTRGMKPEAVQRAKGGVA